jgi:hypothetical protein
MKNKFNFKYIKGGVRLSDRWIESKVNGVTKYDSDGAFIFFLNNCSRIKILTDNSLDCVTYTFHLNPGIESPYISVRSTNIDQPVNILLIKIGFISTTTQKSYVNFERGTTGKYNRNGQHEDWHNGVIGVVSLDGLSNEVSVQNDLFIKTFSDPESPMEPICPAIIGYARINDNETLSKLYQIIKANLEQRSGGFGAGGKYARSDADVTLNFFNVYANNKNVVGSMSIIIMEMMEGYDTLGDKYTDRRFNEFCNMHTYELRRMAQHGYIHTDAHLNNVLINPNYPYFTTNPSDQYYGRALIIDFGKVKRPTSYFDPTYIGEKPGTTGQIRVNSLHHGIQNVLNSRRKAMAAATLTRIGAGNYQRIQTLLAQDFRKLSSNLLSQPVIEVVARKVGTWQRQLQEADRQEAADRQKAEADRQKAEADRQKAEEDRQRQEEVKKRQEADRQRQEAADRQRQEEARLKAEEVARQEKEAAEKEEAESRLKAEEVRKRIAARQEKEAAEKEKAEKIEEMRRLLERQRLRDRKNPNDNIGDYNNYLLEAQGNINRRGEPLEPYNKPVQAETMMRPNYNFANNNIPAMEPDRIAREDAARKVADSKKEEAEAYMKFHKIPKYKWTEAIKQYQQIAYEEELNRLENEARKTEAVTKKTKEADRNNKITNIIVSKPVNNSESYNEQLAVRICETLHALPGSSFVFNEDNTINWGTVVGIGVGAAVFARGIGLIGGNSYACPASAINIDSIPKCFRSMKEYKDMTLQLHPDKNRECAEEANKKFQILNNNKDNQINNYSEINENTYQLCSSSNGSSTLDNFRKQQVERDNEYLKHEDNSTYKEDIKLIKKIFDDCSSDGSTILNEIKRIFENIIKISLEILKMQVNIYDSNANNLSNSNSQILNKKQSIDSLLMNLTKKISEYRNIIAIVLTNNGIKEIDNDPVIINAIVEYTFITYMVKIEEINRCIYMSNGLINAQIGNKIDYSELWFGMPQKTLMITNGTSDNSNQLVNIYSTKMSLSTIPVISNFEIKNLNISPQEFSLNLDEMLQDPIEFKNINFNLIKGGNKFTKKLKTKKLKTKKIRRKTSKNNK